MVSQQESVLTVVKIEFDPITVRGRLVLDGVVRTSVWNRLIQSSISSGVDYVLSSDAVELPWATILTLVREYAPQQRSLGFRFKPEPSAKERIEQFIQAYRIVMLARDKLEPHLSDADVDAQLRQHGFTKRILTPQQRRDVRHLVTLPNGANFSVPGAGKTSVALAVHLLTKKDGYHLLVVAPKSAFPAWRDVVAECMAETASDNNAEEFAVLTEGEDVIEASLSSGAHRFLITYDQMIRIPMLMSYYLSRYPVHVVLDESHRMKAGISSQRGALLLNLSPLPVRRDILTGTPMPQEASDLQSQVDFVWPGMGIGDQISRGTMPRDAINNLYVRTTKAELGLPDPTRRFIQVDMGRGQLGLYTVLRDETRAQLTSFRRDRRFDIVSARRSVMRLLQVSTNPVLALTAMADGMSFENADGITQAVIEEGPSPKMREAANLARTLAERGRKCVIWTIFTDTLHQLEEMLADLNPVSLYGAVPSGDTDDLDTREGRLRRFHDDPCCWALIANPAAASEGISLHKVCHDAIYVDRSYNTAHYLQSVDRIHRLGLDPRIDTNIHIIQSRAPQGLGSIDHSVSRRLAVKLRALQTLLDDPDLHRLALDEENADAPIDFDILPEDLDDLLAELEGVSSFTEDQFT